MSDIHNKPFRRNKPKMVTQEEIEASLPTTLSFLNNSFAKAMRTFPSKNNVVGEPLYDFQVRFSYLLDDIQRGPVYIVSKRIAEANSLIAEVTGYTR